MLPWTQIDTVLLDMDGTLLDLAFDNYFWLEYLPYKYADHHNIPLEQAISTLTSMSESVLGSLQWYCLDHWTAQTGLDIQTLKYEVRHLIMMRPHVPEFIEWLEQSGKQVILVTNAHPKALALKSTESGLDNHLNHMVSSHEFSLAKENQHFWHKLADREKLDLAHCLLVDDSLPVLDRAIADGVGQVLQMLHPDSKGKIKQKSTYPGIVHFDELMEPALG